MSRKLMTFEKNNVFLTSEKAALHPKVIRTPFKCISLDYLKISHPFVTNILHFVFNITGNTSSDFLQKLKMSGKVFSPPEPSRVKFTPSGRVFPLSRPLAWTLERINNKKKVKIKHQGCNIQRVANELII